MKKFEEYAPMAPAYLDGHEIAIMIRDILAELERQAAGDDIEARQEKP